MRARRLLPVEDNPAGLELTKRAPEVLRRVCARRIPVVILTSSLEEQDVSTSFDLGVNSYIRSPVDFNQCADGVSNLGFHWLVINEPPPLL